MYLEKDRVIITFVDKVVVDHIPDADLGSPGQPHTRAAPDTTFAVIRAHP